MNKSTLVNRLCEITERLLHPKVARQRFAIYNVGLLHHQSIYHLHLGIPKDPYTFLICPASIEEGRKVLRKYTFRAIRIGMTIDGYSRQHRILRDFLITDLQNFTKQPVNKMTKLKAFVDD